MFILEDEELLYFQSHLFNPIPTSPRIITGTVINFQVNPVELTPVPVFDPYYPDLNPNPLSGIL